MTRAGSKRASLVVGAAAAAGTVAFLIPGAGRGYDLDSGLAVGLFIATRSIGDAFTRSFLLTNQVFFSFLEHLVYSVTGSKSDLVMRLLPIALAAAAVGLLASLLARHCGAIAGVAGAAVMATNPLFAVEGSQVRGYSLVVLCAIVTTALLARGMSRPRMSTAARLGYAVAGAIGVATHLYMLVVLAIHAMVSLRSRRLATQLVVPWLAALLGLVVYVDVAPSMRIVAKVTGRTFRPTFPRDLAVDLLGGGVVVAIVVLAIVVPVVWRRRRDRTVQLGATAVICAVVVIWLIAPTFLYPRFFVWLVPIPATAVAAAVARRRVTVVLVVMVVVLQIHTAWPRLTTDMYPNRQAGKIFNEVAARHGQACVLNSFTGLRLVGYTLSFAGLTQVGRLDRCTVAFGIGRPPETLERNLDRALPYRTTLHAQTDGVLWSSVPTACWTSRRPHADCRLRGPT